MAYFQQTYANWIKTKIGTSSSQPELSIYNVPIEKVTSVKSLGISIDENLRLQTHISIII